MATNLEMLQRKNIDEMTNFLDNHKHYHCLHCFYHYEKSDCYDKDCKEGYKKWLETENTVITKHIKNRRGK